jgi:hypothetical protein
MKVGEKVRHVDRPDVGIGEIQKIYPDGQVKVVFPTSTFSGIETVCLRSVEQELIAAGRSATKQQVIEAMESGEFELARKIYESECTSWWDREDFVGFETAIKHQLSQNNILNMLESGEFDKADKFYDRHCAEWWNQNNYFSERAEFESRYRDNIKQNVLKLLDSGQFEQAETMYEADCREWWDRENYAECKKIAEHKHSKYKVLSLLEAGDFHEANAYFYEHCIQWWKGDDYQLEKAKYQFLQEFVKTYLDRSLTELDALFNSHPGSSNLSSEDYILLKLPKIENTLSKLGINLDEEQLRANAIPEKRLLIKARAGSGKTRTLCARASLSITDENLDPNQVLVLAFNKSAASEVQQRIQKMSNVSGYSNARTFHSLAYQLVKPKKKLLFDEGGHPSQREQSRFVQAMMQRILNPAFKEKMVQFFRQGQHSADMFDLAA